MLKSVCLVGAVLLLASPALAETSCGTTPIAPAIPAGSSLAGKTADEATAIKHEAFVQVKAYQGTLKPFRECLVKQTSALKATAGDPKDDAAKAAAAKRDADDKIAAMQKAYDKTVDDETQIVNDFVALQTAVCKIVECPAPKK
jgi:hypothetical protein